MTAAAVRLGFACTWDRDPERTWSRTPWELRAALRRRLGDPAVPDVGLELPDAARAALRLAALRRRSGRWVAAWEHLPVWERWAERTVDRRATALGCDAVLQIQDLAATAAPSYLYQDLSYDVVLGLLDRSDEGLGLYFPHLDRSAVLRRRDRQRRIYDAATGVLAMSRFLADSLVRDSGLDPAKVHVVRPGAMPSDRERPDPAAVAAARRRLDGPRRRLLFVGTTFRVKAGDTVVAALERLRREVDPAISLTVAGPDAWPMAGEIPEGVRFVGRVGAGEVDALYDGHDLLVVPSRLEGFGKVFVEALSRGLPCIGRDAFAMPELVTPGGNGDLVRSEDPVELAGRIAAVLADDGIYRRTAAEADRVRAAHTWDRAADEIVAVVERDGARWSSPAGAAMGGARAPVGAGQPIRG